MAINRAAVEAVITGPCIQLADDAKELTRGPPLNAKRIRAEEPPLGREPVDLASKRERVRRHSCWAPTCRIWNGPLSSKGQVVREKE